MAALLSEIAKVNDVPENITNSSVRVAYYDSTYKAAGESSAANEQELLLAQACLENGEEKKSIYHCNAVIKRTSNNPDQKKVRLSAMRELAMAWLRAGEIANCISNHSGESCIFPIKGGGIYTNTDPTRKAIEIYKAILSQDTSDLSSRWLMNIAYMTINEYPDNVPSQFLIPSMNKDTGVLVKPFVDAAMKTGLNVRNRAGGTIVDDFDNDGYLDVICSGQGLHESMHYFKNNGDGTFSDLTETSGLKLITGGINIMQTDYNNDGFKDVFVTRRGKTKFATEPNSLLRNNGNGTFTDVTEESGLLSFYPSQSATWADFNNDGWLDVFIGNQAEGLEDIPCELYINNKNGTFTEVAAKANAKIKAFVKGVTSGDFDNDGLTDLFISSQNGIKMLLKNTGIKDGIPIFTDIAMKAGITNTDGTGGTWFWDYDNDGWMDIMIFSKKNTGSPTSYFAAEALGKPLPDYDGKLLLYRNKHDGTFEEVAKKVGLNKVVIAMGNNFGDIDNDGYLDFYLGTGNLDFSALVPNKLFKNVEGKYFTDVTNSARVGNLQKGHGVSFADMDNDGDEDIYNDLGGAYKADVFESSLYLNPGQNQNHWIKLDLKGVKANRVAIGARIKVFFRENGIERMVCRDVNSGGSFGSNPLMQQIGIGGASVVEKVEIKWPGDNAIQVFKNLEPDQIYVITQGSNVPVMRKNIKKLNFMDKNRISVGCAPLSLRDGK